MKRLVESNMEKRIGNEQGWYYHGSIPWILALKYSTSSLIAWNHQTLRSKLCKAQGLHVSCDFKSWLKSMLFPPVIRDLIAKLMIHLMSSRLTEFLYFVSMSFCWIGLNTYIDA
jgi:hypothetical protein